MTEEQVLKEIAEAKRSSVYWEGRMCLFHPHDLVKEIAIEIEETIKENVETYKASLRKEIEIMIEAMEKTLTCDLTSGTRDMILWQLAITKQVLSLLDTINPE